MVARERKLLNKELLKHIPCQQLDSHGSGWWFDIHDVLRYLSENKGLDLKDPHLVARISIDGRVVSRNGSSLVIALVLAYSDTAAERQRVFRADRVITLGIISSTAAVRAAAVAANMTGAAAAVGSGAGDAAAAAVAAEAAAPPVIDMVMGDTVADAMDMAHAVGNDVDVPLESRAVLTVRVSLV